MMQVSKKIPFDDPQVLMGVRILYVVTNLLIAGLYYFVQMKINKKKGTLSALFNTFRETESYWLRNTPTLRPFSSTIHH